MASSSSITLSTNFYLNSFYRANTGAYKKAGRSELTKAELAYEDSRALRRAVKTLSSNDYSSDDSEKNIKNSITAFATTYNNALSSGESSFELARYSKQLKKIIQDHKDELEDVGIKVSEDGSLSVSESLLTSASMDTLKSVFSSDSSDILSSTRRVSRNMFRQAYDSIYTQMTGNGGRINVIL